MSQFRFYFGKKRRSFYDWVKLGIALNLTIDVVSTLPWFTRKGVFNYIDDIQLRSDYDFLNEYIIKDREFLSYRLERELNKSIQKYNDKDRQL